MSSEAKVGLGAFIGMVLLFLLASQVGSFQNISKEGYRVKSNFDDVSGLDVNSKIKANGIEVGYIENLKILGSKVQVEMFIYNDMKIPKNSLVKPQQESMLGGKYVALTLGDSSEPLVNGDLVEGAPRMMDFNDASNAITEAAKNFSDLTMDVKSLLDGDTKKSLQMTFVNLRIITNELKKFMKLNTLSQTTDNFNKMAIKLAETGDSFTEVANNINNKLPNILKNLDTLVKDLKVASLHIKEKVPQLSDRFAEIENELEGFISENRKPVNSAINSADSFFSTGTQTFDKVDELLNTINKVQLEVAMRSEYGFNDEANKGFISLNYIPSDSKQFQFDIVSVEDYTKYDDDGKLIEPKKHDKGKVLLSAQVAKRYDDLVLRGGIIESAAGAGVDYYALDDKFKASAQVHDFNAVYDKRGTSPHAKISARYTFLKHVDLYGGYDNFLNKEADNAFIGLGVRFFDDDLKTLIMSQSLGSMAN
jgi:phospholipid/cholesterol/gamma-HCH transport system substrate-binding protein